MAQVADEVVHEAEHGDDEGLQIHGRGPRRLPSDSRRTPRTARRAITTEPHNGLAKDEDEAARWFRKAADQGNAWAQYSLGKMYERGIGVARDEAEAARRYREAADQGHVDAMTSLDRLK